jgi:peroxiredoxin
VPACGGTLLTVCPEHVEFADPLRVKHGLTFPLLVDPGSRVAGSFGLLFDLPDDLCALYRDFGIDLARFNTHGRWELPMPATYVIDRAGTIRYAAVNVDYTRRPEPRAALVVLAGFDRTGKGA